MILKAGRVCDSAGTSSQIRRSGLGFEKLEKNKNKTTVVKHTPCFPL
jgi:hypothetical protein